MQFSTIFTVLATAMTATAMPSAALVVRAGDVSVCSSSSTQVCCNGVADCLINVAAKNCDGSSYCCESNSVQGGLVNLDAGCLKLL